MLSIHVVSHTHWDREWYHTAGRFRQRLVALVDELLDDPPAAGASFLLDGQAVVLEDYLAVRPERAGELAAALQRGAIEAGPWFVLADELIPGGEALVRNLLAGRRVLRALRADAPGVLYCPDSFGHPAALPELAQGFGLPMTIVWRGFGGARWPEGDACWWHAPSGARVLLYHLPPSGYEFGESLPTDPVLARERWQRISAVLQPRARLGLALLTNGADHHARQLDLPLALEQLRQSATPVPVVASSLNAFAAAAVGAAASRELPAVQGELRDSYGYAWTLQGTLASRAHQKRRARIAERVLVRDVEPWAALAARRGGASSRALVNAAWRELLLCHPHDTLCGCSIDAVARAMDARLDEVAAQADGLRQDAVHALVGQDADWARRARESWRPQVLLRNPAARSRAGVAIVEIREFGADVPVGPGSARTHRLPRRRASASPHIDGLGEAQLLDTAFAFDRTEAPRAYPDNDLVRVTHAAVWIPHIDGYAVRPHELHADGIPNVAATLPHVVESGVMSMSNGLIAVHVGDDGRVACSSADGLWRVDDLLALEDQDDLGDLYTPSPRGEVRRAEFLNGRMVVQGPLRSVIETRWRVNVRTAERVTVRVRLLLDAGAPFVRVHVTGGNAARDHRLRLRVRTNCGTDAVVADAAFGPVERAPLNVPDEDQAAESVPPTAPLHRYVSVFGAARGVTLYADGLAEYEATLQGDLIATLLRAVGELSRADLPERPGHAGWPEHAPQAQCLGPFGAEFAVFPHGPRSEATAIAVEQVADDVLLPIAGATLRSAVSVRAFGPGLALEGDGLAFSCARESEDGAWMVLRCVNLLAREVSGRWAMGIPIREARLSRLDETPGDAIPCDEHGVSFVAPPRAVVTVLVR
ncbi:MAG TPA: hypothetical protein VG818_02610 [Gemmatimonadaceae bacterium]|nr:hypothetical protein [Gemmatimonadaceae bacterium]